MSRRTGWRLSACRHESRATAQGQALHHFGPDATRVPYLAYAPQLALGRLVEDHLAQNPNAPRLQRVVDAYETQRRDGVLLDDDGGEAQLFNLFQNLFDFIERKRIR